MLIRIIDIIVIALIVGFSIWWLLKTYVFDPRKKAQEEIANTTETAIEKAEVDYLEIRKAWLSFYNLNKNREFYADAMDNIKIPEVAAFQRMMVSMNQQYNDLKGNNKTDESFVGKALVLRTLFDEAVLAAKRESLE